MRLSRSILLVLAVLYSGLLGGCENSEERAQRHFESALQLIEDGDVDRALVELRNVLKFDNEHKEGRLAYAEILRERGDLQDSFGQYLRLVEQDPDMLVPRMVLSRMALDIDDLEQATLHGRAAGRIAPKDPEAVFLNAAIDYFSHTGPKTEVEDQVALAFDFLEDHPDDPIAWRMVIDRQISAENFDEALGLIDTALERLPETRALYLARLGALEKLGRQEDIGALLLAMTGQFPGDAQIQTWLIDWYRMQQDVDGAEAFLRRLADAPDADQDSKLAVVRFLRTARSAEAAQTELDRLIEAEPENTSYRSLRAVMAFEAGQTDQAIAAMTDMLSGAGASESASNLRVLLARMLETTGAHDAARAQVDLVLSEDKSHVDALKMRAGWLIEQDRTDDAINALRTALDQAVRDPAILTLMGQAYERAGDLDLAGERYALAVEASRQAPAESLRYSAFLASAGRFDTAEAILAEALGRTPSHAGLLVALAQLHLAEEEWEGVDRILARLRSIQTPEAAQRANEIQTEKLLRQKRSDEAIAFLGDLSRTGQGGSAALATLVQTMLDQGRTRAARAMLDERLKAAPDDPILLVLSGAAYEAAGNLERAAQTYESVFEARPEDDSAARVLYRFLVRHGQEAKAATVLERALAAAPTSVPLRLFKAAALEQAQDWDGAIALYETLYKTESFDPVIANNLASLISTYRSDEASLERAYLIARRLRDTDIPAFQDTYGWIVFRRGDPATALPHLASAAQGLPQDPMVQYHLGAAHFALGNRAAAREVLTRALDLPGGSALAQYDKAREYLAELGGE